MGEVVSIGGTIKHRLPFIEFVVLCIFSLFYIDFQIQARYQLSAPFFALGYIGYCYFKEPSLRKVIFGGVLACVIIALMYQFMTIPITIQGSNVSGKYLYSNFTQYIMCFFPLAMLYRVCYRASKKQVLVILSIIFCAAVVLVQAALAFAAIDPGILHTMNSERLEEAGVSIQGYNFVYAFTFLIITCIEIIRNGNTTRSKCLAGIGLVYSLYFLFTAQFALSIVTTFISCLYLYYISAKNQLLKIVVIISLIILYLALPSILEQLIAFTHDSEVLNVRLREIYDSITGNHSDKSDMQARLDLYWLCIEAFLKSPILGNAYLPFNGHSTFLLGFAYLGIFGGCLICWLFYRGAKFSQMIMGSRYLYFRPLMLQVVLMGLTNPIQASPANFIMLFFVCPLLIMKCVKS